MVNKISWKWSTFKSNVKKQPLLIIVPVLLLIGLSIMSVNYAIESRQEDRKFAEKVKLYEEWVNHTHPHDPVSQTNLDPEVQ